MSWVRRLAPAVAAASGLATTLAFPGADLGYLAPFLVAPFLWTLIGVRARRGALLGFLYGLAFFGVLLSWIIAFGYLAWGLLVLTQAGLFAIFGALTARGRWGSGRVSGIIEVGALFAAIEIVRSNVPVVGFEWGALGYTTTGGVHLNTLAPFVGVHVISGFAAAIAAYLVILSRLVVTRTRPIRTPGIAVAVFVLFLVPIGLSFLPTGIGPELEPLEIAVVQGNVPRDRFSGIGRSGRVGPEDTIIIRNHLDVTAELIESGARPNLVVWPENAFDRDPSDVPDLTAELFGQSSTLDAPFIVGAIARTADGRDANATLLIEPGRGFTDRYEKHHLVPFGEYVPWGWPRRLVPALRTEVPTDLIAGRGSSTFLVGGIQVGNAICYESTYTRDVRRIVGDGAEIILVSTNNASYGTSAASAQHLQMSRMRALEHRKPVVQAAISGISAFIDADGGVHDQTELFEPAVVRREVIPRAGRTIFARFGGSVEGGIVLLGFLLALMVPRRRGWATPVAVEAPQRVVVAIPTYDEAATVEETVHRVLAALPEATVLIVDDASPDGTGVIADRLALGDARVQVLHRPGREGLGHAYRAAFAHALTDPEVDAVVEVDCDGSHDPADLPRLVEAARTADLVIGSRYVPGGGTRGWSLRREALSGAGNVYARTLLRFDVADATAGFRLYRRAVLDAIDLEAVRSDGYAFQIEMTLRAWRAGFAVTEVPIMFTERRAGASKMHGGIVIEAIFGVARWAFRGRAAKRPHPRSVAAKQDGI